jgi:hypothetical protein
MRHNSRVKTLFLRRCECSGLGGEAYLIAYGPIPGVSPEYDDEYRHASYEGNGCWKISGKDAIKDLNVQ